MTLVYQYDVFFVLPFCISCRKRKEEIEIEGSVMFELVIFKRGFLHDSKRADTPLHRHSSKDHPISSLGNQIPTLANSSSGLQRVSQETGVKTVESPNKLLKKH